MFRARFTDFRGELKETFFFDKVLDWWRARSAIIPGKRERGNKQAISHKLRRLCMQK